MADESHNVAFVNVTLEQIAQALFADAVKVIGVKQRDHLSSAFSLDFLVQGDQLPTLAEGAEVPEFHCEVALDGPTPKATATFTLAARPDGAS